MRKFFVSLCLLFFGLLSPTIAFAADTCKGFYDNNGTKQTQEGICFYTNNESPGYSTVAPLACSLPGSPVCGQKITVDCTTMANKTGRKGTYNDIQDAIQQCRKTVGIDYRCCAPADQSTMNSHEPPPPCTMNAAGACIQVDTGLGTIQVDPGNIVKDIFGILLGISGGIAIVIIIFSGYRIMFAQGDPEKLQEARQRITSAIIGLLFIIFSVVILRVIGVDVLHLPGFNP